MINSNAQISRLLSKRNSYGKQNRSEKVRLLSAINFKTVNSKKNVQELYSILLFFIAYPENKIVYKLALESLNKLKEHLQANKKIQYNSYNSGITGTSTCAAFSFEMVKWLRKTRPLEISLNSFEAGDSQIQSVLSVVMSKTESEILQDANAEWKGWLKQTKNPAEDLLDQLIAIFDSSDLRPEIKEELWNTIGINVEINFTSHCCLPKSLTQVYYHRSLIKPEIDRQPIQKPVKVKLSETEAEQIIDCSRMILLRNLRELDPISFTSAKHITLYQLQRGFSIALTGMVPDRRHPIDSYMGYLVFKNGVPVAYAGSWILFDSARIGLNVFSDYRGGETKYIFNQVLQLHSKIYRLKRFTVDPYQIGKENSDGIKSGAFWIYYHAGFRPLKKVQQDLAAAEMLKIKADRKYRSPSSVLKKLANSRLELMLRNTAFRFDATDLSLAYAGMLSKKFNGNRNLAENNVVKKLSGILQVKDHRDENMKFILKNWGLLLLSNEKGLAGNGPLKKMLRSIFILKAKGSEEAYIKALQRSDDLRKYMEKLIKEFAT